MSERAVPPVGEEIHIPGPSIQPALTTLGLSLLLIGILEMWPVAIIGGLLMAYQIVLWIRDTRRDIGELPAESHH